MTDRPTRATVADRASPMSLETCRVLAMVKAIASIALDDGLMRHADAASPALLGEATGLTWNAAHLAWVPA